MMTSNIAGALAALFEFVNKVSRPLSEDRLSARNRDKAVVILKNIDSVLGIMNFEEEFLSTQARNS